MCSYDLSRFHKAQEIFYPHALREIKRGRKQTHWMWFIFPQLRALGHSPKAVYYGIESIEEAKAYLDDPVLRARLYEISEALLATGESDPVLVMGEIDALKLCSSMTLFWKASDGEEIFRRVLDQFYGGKEDMYTLSILSET